MAEHVEGTPQQRWKLVYDRRKALADAIDETAKAQARTIRGRIRAVTRFLRRDGSYEAAIVRPDVIAFTQPLLVSDNQETLTDQQLVWAASNGLNSLSYQPATVERFSQLLIYPVIIAFAGFGIYLGFAFFVAPEFERMFYEFGIELPALTSGLLRSASFLRSIGWLIGILTVAFLVLCVFWLMSSGAIISRIKFLKHAFQNEKQTMAELAYHAAQLRSAGLSAKQSFAAAWFASGQNAAVPYSDVEQLNAAEGETLDEPIAIRTPGFPLLELALQRPANYANDRMLLEVADSYRRRTVTVSDWWISWLVYGFQCALVIGVLFMVVSMFMPLISIVSGLTGN